MEKVDEYNQNMGKIRERDKKSADLNYSINKVAKGTVIVFFGIIMGMILALIGRVLFARYFSPSEYGIFSLGIILLNIFTIIGSLGLQGGVTRQIAYNYGKNQINKVKSIIIWSLVFGSIISIIISLILFLSADFISLQIFNITGLSLPLKIISFTIPFYVILLILMSLFRGLKQVKERIIFNDFIKNLLFPLFLIVIILISGSFKWGIIAYCLSIIITTSLFFIYFIKKYPIKLEFTKKILKRPIGKELIFFSLPLMLVAILDKVLHWTDTIMLGYYKTPEIVGLYNSAVPLGSFISTALGAMLFIYTPIISDLYARRKDTEMRRNYAILTKWLCFATFPLTMLFVLYPKIVINFFFGQNYIFAYTVLQILVIGFFINNIMGPNGATLTAMAKTNFLMIATFSAACINVVLNIVLIPKYGVHGAAIATVTALVSINFVRSAKLYSISKIHSLNKNIFKPIIVSCVLFIILYFILKETLIITWWMLPFLFIIFIIIYCFSFIITKSFDREDIDLLLNIERKTGLNFKRVKSVLKRFV